MRETCLLLVGALVMAVVAAPGYRAKATDNADRSAIGEAGSPDLGPGEPASANASEAVEDRLTAADPKVPRGSSQSPLRKLREASPAVVPAVEGAIPPKVLRYAEQIIRKYDRDGDRQLKEEESSSLPESLRVSDFDRDGVITQNEFARRIVAYGRRRTLRIATLSSRAQSGVQAAGVEQQHRGGDSPNSARPDSAPLAPTSEEKRPAPPKRFAVAETRLPVGVPEWFLACDEDGDGQVSLAETTRHGAPDVASRFSEYDRDGDGMITAAESVISADKGQPPGESAKIQKPTAAATP